MDGKPDDPHEVRTVGEEGNVRTFDAPERPAPQSGRTVVWAIIAAVVVILLIRWIF